MAASVARYGSALRVTDLSSLSAANATGMAVHIHQTRHTYARIVAEETGSFLETQEALDHENAATTRVYVQRITVKADKHSSKVAQRLKFRQAT